MDSHRTIVPILLNGFGRSGSTAIMALLGTNPKIAFDRTYPFETRCLSYLAKMAMLAGRVPDPQHFDAVQLFEFESDHFGSPPFPDGLVGGPSTDEILSQLTQLLFANLHNDRPESMYYAEKAPPWLAAMMRRHGPVKVVHLIRDPRDTFLSASAFRESAGAMGFGRADQSVVQQARQIIRGWLGACENERADRGREDALVVRYEDWVTDPARVVQALSEFLGVELNPNAPELTQNLSRHQTSKKLSESVERWRREPLPKEVAEEVPALTQDFLGDYRYEVPAHLPTLDVTLDPTWNTSSDGSWKRTAEGLEITLYGPDAYIIFPEKRLEAHPNAEIWMCVRGDTGSQHSLFWRGPGRAYREKREVRVPFRPAEHWQVIALPLGQHEFWRGSIDEMRLDVFNGHVQQGRHGLIRWVRCMGLDELTRTSSVQ